MLELDAILTDLRDQGWSQQPVLSAGVLEKIGGYFDANRARFKEAKVGPAGSQRREASIRGDLTLWLDPRDLPAEFGAVGASLSELRDLLNEKFYLGLKDYECHLALYPPGSFYRKHSDRFEKTSSRVLSFVFYLHRSWEKGDGGELLLYNQAGEVLREVEPRPGSFVCFLSEEFPHEVRLAGKERRSLTGWFHDKTLS